MVPQVYLSCARIARPFPHRPRGFEDRAVHQAVSTKTAATVTPGEPRFHAPAEQHQAVSTKTGSTVTPVSST